MKKSLFVLTLFFISTVTYAKNYSIEIKGMHCNSCSKIIKAKLCALPQLKKCDVTLGKATLSFEDTVTPDESLIKTTISTAGSENEYQAGSLKEEK